MFFLFITQIQRALQFLHDLGTIQYFDNDFLRDHIVIDPQWIVDVMAAVVSVTDSKIKVRTLILLIEMPPFYWEMSF